MRRVALLSLIVFMVFLGFAATANAYLEGYGQPWGTTTDTALPGLNKISSSTCTACHGVADPSETTVNTGAPYRSTGTPPRQYVTGPHGRYTNSTDKCRACHDAHEAIGSLALLPANTEFGVCNTCHDLSFTSSGAGSRDGGGGVYGAIRARGQTVGARHNIMGYNNTEAGYEATNVIPGSDLAALPTSLTCSGCHSPHGNTQIAFFLGERIRVMSSTGSLDITNTSNKLLQDNLAGNSHGTYTVYGSSWCAACHNRRHDDRADLNNHPVEMVIGYTETSATAEGVTWQTFVSADATLPARQAGWSREASSGWEPLCQQCHEDVRNVESAYSVTSIDGTNTADNPRFQTFPHETLSDNMTVETGDDLCLNCHSTIGLP